MKKGKSYQIAQCSMSVSLSVLILIFGHSVGVGEFFWYYVASLLIDLPERPGDKALCYIGTVFLSAIGCGFNFVYLAAFCLLIAPYPLVKAFARKYAAIAQRCIVTAFWFCAMGMVCWWTPMFFVQLGTIQSNEIRLIAIGVLMIISLIIDPLYSRLYQAGKKILQKAWLRIL